MLNVEKLLNQTSTESTTVHSDPYWISRRDLEYAYGQIKMTLEASRQFNLALTAGSMKGCHR